MPAKQLASNSRSKSGPSPQTSTKTSARMRATKGRNNTKELAIRSALHAAGYRFRVCLPVPGVPRRSIDIAFVGIKLAIFLDGCFWHACPVHGTMPKTDTEWWAAKLKRNRERDNDTDRVLIQAGWHPARFWEHTDDREIVHRVTSLVRALSNN